MVYTNTRIQTIESVSRSRETESVTNCGSRSLFLEDAFFHIDTDINSSSRTTSLDWQSDTIKNDPITLLARRSIIPNAVTCWERLTRSDKRYNWESYKQNDYIFASLKGGMNGLWHLQS